MGYSKQLATVLAHFWSIAAHVDVHEAQLEIFSRPTRFGHYHLNGGHVFHWVENFRLDHRKTGSQMGSKLPI